MSPDSQRAPAAARTAALLAAAFAAFDGMVALLHERADDAGVLTAPFVMAAVAAADGRDALAFAPSIPAADLESPPPLPAPGTMTEFADGLAEEARLLGARLAIAVVGVTEPGDRAAIAAASRHADDVYACLSGSG